MIPSNWNDCKLLKKKKGGIQSELPARNGLLADWSIQLF